MEAIESPYNPEWFEPSLGVIRCGQNKPKRKDQSANSDLVLMMIWDMDERRGLEHPMKRGHKGVPALIPEPAAVRMKEEGRDHFLTPATEEML